MNLFITTLLLSVIVDHGVSTPLLQWPMINPKIVQGFGVTEFVKAHPDFYRYGEHLAVDLDGGFGTPILSAADGLIIAVGNGRCPNYSYPACNFGYGNWLLIWHESLNLTTLYQHLFQEPIHEIGAVVKTGDVVGFQGASGKVIGSHLHFAVFEGPVRVYNTRDGNIDFQILGREKIKNPLMLLPRKND